MSENQSIVYLPFGLYYLGFEAKDSFEGWNEDLDFILGIGDNTIRLKVAQLIKSKNKKIKTITKAHKFHCELEKKC